jgi:hypothetical protein
MSDGNGSADAGNPGAPAASGGSAPWYAMDGMAPEQTGQLGDLVKAKGWKHPSEALMSYSNLERLFGADKAGRTILAPKGDDDAAGWESIYDRLGRPKSPDEYKLPVPEGDEGEFAKAAAPVLHKLGLTTRQAQGLAEWWNATKSESSKAEAEAFSAKTETDWKALQTEWGAAAKQNEALAQRAVAKFGQQAGLDADGLERLERAIGTGPMMKLFHAIGASFAEGTFVASDAAGGSSVMTPAQAQSKINSKFADKEFMARYMHNDSRVRQGAIDEMMALQRMAHPELAG